MKRWLIGILTGLVTGGLVLAQEAAPTKASSEIREALSA